MAQLLPNGRQQFLDANGNPLAGGLVYFYIPNTTTPKDTWQDAAKSALNTNPVVCDARGQATIYGDGDYRQILKDAAGNSIWDKNVSVNSLQRYDQGSEPTTDQGDIWINGIGACRWDGTDSKYYRIPYFNKVVVTVSGAVPFDAYTKHVRYSGCAAGGGGGAAGAAGGGTTVGSGGGGGGYGQWALNQEAVVAPGSTLNVVIGAKGTGGVGNGTGTGGSGGDGGNTVLSGAIALTLTGGKGGSGGQSGVNTTAGGPLGGAGYPGGGAGSDCSSGITGSGTPGNGASGPFGGGGQAGRSVGNGQGIPGANAGGYGAGGSGGGGTYATQAADHITGANGGTGADGLLIVEY